MRYRMSIFLILIPAWIGAQNFHITVEADSGLVLELVVRDLEGPAYDTFYQSRSFSIRHQAEIPVAGTHRRVARPLQYVFEGGPDGYASGLMIDDTLHFKISRNDGRLSIQQTGQPDNRWFTDLINPDHRVWKNAARNDDSAKAAVLQTLSGDVTVENSEIKALLLYSILTREYFTKTDAGAVNHALSAFPAGRWADRCRTLWAERLEKTDRIENFEFLSSSGEVTALDSVFDKDYLLLDFWASWCGPCLQAMDKLREVYPSYKHKLTIISLSIDQSQGAWEKTSKRLGLPWISAYDTAPIERKIQTHLSIGSIPLYILLNGKHEVLYRGADLSAALEQIGK